MEFNFKDYSLYCKEHNIKESNTSSIKKYHNYLNEINSSSSKPNDNLVATVCIVNDYVGSLEHQVRVQKSNIKSLKTRLEHKQTIIDAVSSQINDLLKNVETAETAKALLFIEHQLHK